MGAREEKTNSSCEQATVGRRRAWSRRFSEETRIDSWHARPSATVATYYVCGEYTPHYIQVGHPLSLIHI